MQAINCTKGNYTLEDNGNDIFTLHYLGDGWKSVERTKEQVQESKSFFDLWYNY